MCMDDFDWLVEWHRWELWDGTSGVKGCDCGHLFTLGESFLLYGGSENPDEIDDACCEWCYDEDENEDGALLMQDDYGNAFYSSTEQCRMDHGGETFIGAQCAWCAEAARWLDRACEGMYGWNDIYGQVGDHFGDEIDADEQRYPKTARLAVAARRHWLVADSRMPVEVLGTWVDEAIAELALVHH